MIRILVTVPNLATLGGVSTFWNSLLLAFQKFKDIEFVPLEIGGHGKNPVTPLLDQWNFNKSLKSDIELVFLNPSMVIKSFFRDGFFAKQLNAKKVPFVVFFHGWDLDFEKSVDKHHVNFFLNSFGKAETIFVLSKDFKDKIISWGYQGRVVVETTMVDETLISNFTMEKRVEALATKKRIKILFLARIVREKGVFRTIEAFKNLSKDIDNIELVIAGDGEALDEVKALTSDIENISVLGRVQGQEKIDIFKNSDIYVFPTNYGEGLPISVLEAMLFGMAVITTHDGGLKYFFEDHKMGYVVDPTDISALEKCMRELVLDREKMLEFGKFNFDYAQKYLTNSTIAQRLYPHLKRRDHVS